MFVCSWGPHQNKNGNESFDEHLENVDWHGFNRHICIKFISALANSFSALNTVAKLPSRMSLIELFSWIVDTKHNVPSSISILLIPKCHWKNVLGNLVRIIWLIWCICLLLNLIQAASNMFIWYCVCFAFVYLRREYFISEMRNE